MTIANAARALNLQARRRHRAALRLPPLLVMTDATRLNDPRVVLDRLPRGSGIILRHYTLDRTARMALARALVPACRARGLRLLVAGDAAMAAASGADGVHLPEWMTRTAGAGGLRLHRRPGWIVTAACHSGAALVQARRIGADAAVLAPVFATPSHPETPALGAVRFAALAHETRLPVYALGGITAAGARRLRDSGAAGVAGIGFATGNRSDSD